MVVRQLHNFSEKFHSVVDLHAKLIEELTEQVPDSLTVIMKDHTTQKSGYCQRVIYFQSTASTAHDLSHFGVMAE